MTIIDYTKDDCTALGRNGEMLQIGLMVEDFPKDSITLRPINSREVVGRCSLEIPKENIDELISALQQIQ